MSPARPSLLLPLAFLSLATILSACEASPTSQAAPHLTLSTKLDQGIILLAATWWNERLGDEVFTQGDADGQLIILQDPDAIDDTLQAQEYGDIQHGLCLIALQRPPNRYDGGADRRLVIHELGHCLGLSHSTDPESVMFPNPPGHELTPDTAAELQALFPDLPTDPNSQP